MDARVLGDRAPLQLEMRDLDWARTAVVLVTPDAVVRRLYRDVVEDLRSVGLEVLAYKLVRLGPDEIDALYQVNVAFRWETYRYRCVDAMFQFGPSIALLLQTRAVPDTPLHATLQELKGSGPLHDLRPDTLRRRLGSINSILSIVHSAASPDEAERETPILFGQAGSPRVSAFDAASLGDFFDLMDRAHPRETRDFEDVLGGFRARVATAFWRDLSAGGRAAVLEAQAGGGLAARGAGRSLAAHLPPLPAVQEAVSSDFEPGEPPLATPRVWQMLAGHGVETDAWERLVLETSLYFRPWRKDD